MENVTDNYFGCLAMLFILAILILLSGFIVMLLWNWLIPDIFGLSEISIWQAIGLNILLGLLFGIIRIKG